ncbi:MAG: T9SS type A sorting domain-containing protein [Bacteroidota bacterium]
MKKTFLIFILVLNICLITKSQTTRYFEFTTSCGHGNWQDTCFIAAASDQAIIDTVLADLAKPLNNRRFINGAITYGNGGHNHNASHWFLWHFVPDQWSLAEIAIELCDGCPYSDVDADTAYWVGNLGQFCPWSGCPVREISNPSGIIESDIESEITFYPNPATTKLILKWNTLNNITVTIYNSIGQEFMTAFVSKQNETIDITDLQAGLYFLKIKEGNQILIKKIIVANN